MLTYTRNSKKAKVKPIDYNKVKWTGGLWKERFDVCGVSTVPQLQHMFESKDISHVLENFKICAGDVEGDFDGTVFGDGDFYKWMESAVYVAVKSNNSELLKQIDEYIELIERAQQPDGYLSTKQIIGEMKVNGISRMGDINDFEVYNFGHMFTSACLHYRLTGKENFLNIAKRVAVYLENLYDDAKKTGEVQTAVCPSHYMGLIEMYRTIGDKKYLNLAKLAIELRDSVKDGLDDNQDRLPLKEHRKIIGHAVRANYLYAGVADLCLEEDNDEYSVVLDSVWKDLINKKMYITGGCGALYNGTSPYGNFFIDQKTHQAYGYEYQLPNITAYNETCASIGAVMWAYRMFQLNPKAEYFDVLETMMLNTNLAALSLDGKKFFYENMLRRAEKMDFELIWPLTRSEYILSYCCPPNLARIIAQSSEYAYLTSDDKVWFGMYGESEAIFSLKNGSKFTLNQKTNYPFNGRFDICFSDIEDATPFSIMLRIPKWVKKGYIKLNNKTIEIGVHNASSYKEIKINNPKTDVVEFNLEMEVRYTLANNMVEETTNQVAVEKGPIVYCAEIHDTSMKSLDDMLINLNAKYEEVVVDINGNEIFGLSADHYALDRGKFDRDALYQDFNYTGVNLEKVTFIPYYAWDNRKFGEMRVWFPLAYNVY